MKLDDDICKQELKVRHVNWAGPTIRQCLEDATLDIRYATLVVQISQIGVVMNACWFKTQHMRHLQVLSRT
jgi:hypothetical protein